MKTLLLTLAASLLISPAFAQRVNNGDPGLALTNADTLPVGNVFTRLASAFERGYTPNPIFLTQKQWSGDIYVLGKHSRIERHTRNLRCSSINSGPLLDGVYCNIKKDNSDIVSVDPNWEVETTPIGLIVKDLGRGYLRVYDNQLIVVEYSKNNLCYFSEEAPGADNICSITYLYQ